MNEQEYYEKVCEVLRVSCGVTKPLSRETRLGRDLELDSMGLLSLAVSLENEYRVKLGDNPEQPPETVGEVVKLLREAVEQKS